MLKKQIEEGFNDKWADFVRSWPAMIGGCSCIQAAAQQVASK